MNKLINHDTEIINLGLIDYKEAWDYQEKLFARSIEIKISNRSLPDDSQQKTPNYLIFCEHPHVYTLGKSGSMDNLLIDEEGLNKIHAQFYKINRGGDITYHGPGQLVCYPVIDLENFFTDIHKYLRHLEEAVILTCRDWGLKAGRIEGLTGVWMDFDRQAGNRTAIIPRKICAMGVKTSRWVTMHGLAFNVNTQLEYFKHIVPCGIEDKEVTSLASEIGRNLDFADVQKHLKKYLSSIFGMTFLDNEEGH